MRGTRLRILAVLMLLAAALVAAPAAASEPQPWDQEKVTAIAAELVPATRALRQSMRGEPPGTLGQPGRRSFWRLRDQARSVEVAARQLHDSLAAGEGFEQTYPIYRRMLLTVRSADRELRRVPLLAPVQQNIDAVAGILKRLRAFYEAEPVI